MMNKQLHNHLFGKLGKTLFAWVCILLTVSGTASAQLRSTLFNETIGNVSTTTAIDVHQATGGFDYDGNPTSNPVLSYVGSGDVRNVITSNYSGASGLANIFITSVIGKYFQIGNINTSDPQLTDLRLSFGSYKSNTFSNATELKVEYSTDGLVWTALTYTPVATGSTSNVWVYRTSLDSLPHTNNLRIRFRQTSINVQFRIDDIKVDYKRICSKPIITAVGNGPLTFCQGSSVTLNGTYLDADSYQWAKDGITIVGANAANYTATAAGNYTVTTTVNSISCTKTSDPTAVSVNPNPTASITAPAAFCQDKSADLVASGNGGTGALTYSWTPNPQNADNSNTAIYHVPTATTGTTTYTVTVKDANNCQGNASASVTVNSVPAAPTVTAGGNTTFCDGGSVQFTSSAANGNKWYVNGTLINPAQTGTSYTADANGSYTVTQTLNGCESNLSAAQVVNELVVTTPTASISQGAASVCQNTAVVLSSTASSGNQWFADDIAINGATGTTYTVPTSTASTVSYTVKQTATTNGVTCTSAASNAIVIEVKTIPAAPVASTEAENNTTCQGNDVVFSSSVTSGNQWFDNGVAINGATDKDYIFSAVNAGSKTFTVKQTVNGCTSPASNAVTLTINAIPAQPTVSFASGSAATFCFGGSSTLTSSNGFTYQWYKNGNTIDNATEPTFTVGTSLDDDGDYTVVVTNLNGCYSIPSAAKTITENAIPEVALTSSPAASAGTAEICSGAQATFTATATGASPFTYIFNDGTTTVSSASNTYTASTAATYTVTVTDNNNCASTVSNSIALVVNSLPAVSIGGSGTHLGQFEYCENGGGVTLTANPTGGNGDGTYTYLWSTSATTVAITNKLAGDYSVVATDSKGCSSPAASATVIENPNPTVSVTGNGTHLGQFEYCENGGGVTLTAAGNGGAGNYTYLWNTLPVAATSAVITNKLAGSYSVVATDANGCSSAAGSVTVIENPNPTVSISGNGTNLGEFEYCAGGSLTLTAAGNGGAGNYTYQWANGGPNTAAYAGLTQGTPTPVTYSVVATDAKGCSSAAEDQTITEHANPTIAVTGNGTLPRGQFEYCAGGTGIALTATAAGAASPFTYKWDDNTTDATHTAQLEGTYTVTATDANHCTVTGNATIVQLALPIVTATADPSRNSDVACHSGANFYFGLDTFTTVKSVVSSGNLPYTYAWVGTGVASPTAATTNVVPTDTTTAIRTYNVTVTDAKGCVSDPIGTVKLAMIDVRGAISGNVKVCNVSGTAQNGDKQGITTEVPRATARTYITTGGTNSRCLGACDAGVIAGLPPDPVGGVVPPIPPVPPTPNPDSIVQVIGGLFGKGVTPTYANSIKAYPNPFGESINLAISLAEESAVNIIITDMLGRVVANMNQGTLQAGEYVIPVDGTNMAEGMYACTVKTANTIKVINIVRTTTK